MHNNTSEQSKDQEGENFDLGPMMNMYLTKIIETTEF